jgi:plasmid stabilization system protein ParE
MKCVIRFVPEVEEDVLQSYSWYEKKSFGLGEEFLRMFYACVNELAGNALIYPKVHGQIRRRLLRRFPYVVYFRTVENEVVVLGIFHCARSPEKVETHLSTRRIQKDDD